MKSSNIFGVSQLVLVVGMTVSGCSVLSPQQDHTRYFVLMPTADVARPEPVAPQSRDRVSFAPFEDPRAPLSSLTGLTSVCCLAIGRTSSRILHL